MNRTLTTVLVLIAVLAVAGGIFYAGTMYARINAYGPGMMNGNYPMMGGNGGMMSGNGMMVGNGGMMNGNGMMNQYGYNNTTPLTVDDAKLAANKYIKSLDVNGLEIGEVMIFDNNAYVVVKETETGLGAFELLVDSASGIAYPEHGPNMMWNLKYSGLNHQNMFAGNSSMMGNMMGGMTFAPGTSAGVNGMMNSNGWDVTIPTNISAEMTVTPEQTIEYAQKYLDKNVSGATAAKDPTQFYGYYTLDFEKDGKIIGMLSVNGYSGQVFLHTWHGTFIEEVE